MVTKDRWMELQNTLGHQVPRKGSLSPRRRGLVDCEESPAAAENADDRFRCRLQAAYPGLPARSGGGAGHINDFPVRADAPRYTDRRVYEQGT